MVSYWLFLRDTAGQERFETITAQYLRGAEGIVLVFDLTKSDSVGKAQFWLDSINEVQVYVRMYVRANGKM